MQLKSSWCAFHIVQRYQHTFISLISGSHTKDITHFSLGHKMYNSVVQHIAHHVDCQKISAQVYHSDVSGQSGSIARVTRSTAGRDLSRQLQPKTLTHIQESNDYVQPAHQIPAIVFIFSRTTARSSCVRNASCSLGLSFFERNKKNFHIFV